MPLSSSPGWSSRARRRAAEYKARATRLKKALLLEGEPDRVPVLVLTGYYPATRKGLTPYDVTQDYAKAADAWYECNLDCRPDCTQWRRCSRPSPAGRSRRIDTKILNWPGHGVAKEASFQYTEKEWMSEDEYDLLIDDPTDFLSTTTCRGWPTGLSGFAKLASPLDMIEIVAGTSWMMRWADPDVQASIAKLAKAGPGVRRPGAAPCIRCIGRLVAEGFPGPCSTCPRPRSTSSAIRSAASAA